MEKEFIKTLKTKKDIYKLWNLSNITKTDTSSIAVLLLTAPCNGFGDIVFAMKFSRLLKSWYNCTINIVTTNKQGFVSLGESPDNIYELYGESKASLQCRRFARLFVRKDGVNQKPPESDLIFVAPTTFDQKASLVDIKTLIPYSNKLNTFFLSEYNIPRNMGIDFETGIGKNKCGLLFTDDIPEETLDIETPYTFAYVAQTIGNVKACISGFTELISKKYNGTDFTFVTPAWEHEIIKNNIVKILRKYFRIVIVHFKLDDKVIQNTHVGKGKNTVHLRMDMFPMPYPKMLSLMANSVKDILVTGDQSITDAISCCPGKNIFYQIAPWKEEFAKKLEKEMPNKWLRYKKLSCGSIKAIKYKGDYRDFKDKWDFRKLAREKLDKIFWYTAMKEDDEGLQEYERNVLESKTLKIFKSKYYNKYGEV
jgi:hypothetical protein